MRLPTPATHAARSFRGSLVLPLSSLTAALAVAWAACPAAAAQVRVNGRTFTVPDGFTVELAAAPPLVDRPIEADFDEQGRLYVSDSSGSSENVQKQQAAKPHRVLRLDPADANGRFEHGTVFADHLMFPEGVLWRQGSLYVAAVPSIWKLTDTKAAGAARGAESGGAADQRSEWFAGKTVTGCANDLHGPYAGPDGWIYWCKGAFAQQTYENAGLPAAGAGKPRKPLVTRAAHIFRCRPDGSGLEPVMTGGMDNPVEVAWTRGGERVFTTTFLQEPAGGRRDGLIHAVYGGVYGKDHDVLDGHPRTGPDLMPVLSHLGPAACCGLVRYESGAFGAEYRDNLFVTCFNLHKVTRHELTAAGATFASKDSDFLTCDSLDFHPTDVLEDADGSLLVIDTGGWYKLCCPTSQLGKPDVLGAIYRVRAKGQVTYDDPRGLKVEWDKRGPEELAALLDDSRPAVRRRAVEALANAGVASVAALRRVLAESKSAEARVNAVWSATRIEDPAARAAVRAALGDADETVRQAATHSAGLWRDKEAAPALMQLLATGTAQNCRAAAEALGRIGDPVSVPVLLAAVAKADPADRVLNHSLTYALIEIDDAKATAGGLAGDSPRVRAAALIALDQMDGGGLGAEPVAAALDSADPSLSESAAWIAGRHPEWAEAFVGAMARQWARPHLPAEDRDGLAHQAAALSKAPAVSDWLAARAADSGAPSDQRRLALAAMGKSGLKAAPEPWAKAMAGILEGEDAALMADAVAVLRKLPPAKGSAAEVGEALARLGARAGLRESLRLEALAAVPAGLTRTSPEVFAFLQSQLARGQPVARRLLAAEAIRRAKLDAKQLEAVAELVPAAGPLEIEPLVSAFGQTTDSALGLKLVAALDRAKALASLRAPSLRASLARFGPEVAAAAEPLYARINPDAGRQKARLDELLATLPAGDARRGQAVFNGSKAGCVACHAVGYVGGKVGPDLTSVGKVRAERDLLESIVFPSASFVQSFEPVQVETVSGDRQYGIVRKNDAEEIVLLAGPNQEIRIPKKEVSDVRPGAVSVMPAGFDQVLSPQELADVVAFLKACR